MAGLHLAAEHYQPLCIKAMMLCPELRMQDDFIFLHIVT